MLARGLHRNIADIHGGELCARGVRQEPGLGVVDRRDRRYVGDFGCKLCRVRGAELREGIYIKQVRTSKGG